MIATRSPKFVVMMVGINDRKQMRESVPPGQRVVKPGQEPADKAARELDQPAPDRSETPAVTAPETTFPGANRAVEFRTDAWSQAYIRRIDDTIAEDLRGAGVLGGAAAIARGEIRPGHPVSQRTLSQPRR
jgi:uncharacterized protein